MSGDWTGSSADLRALVREVLRDAVPKGDAQGVPATAPAQASAPAVVESISIRSDADLAAFVQRVLDAAADPGTAAALRSGRVKFVLAGAASPMEVSTPRAAGYRVERGAVTERHVREAAEVGTTLILGSRAVLTPLAKDRARTAGITIEKEN
ncbi:MAG: hypothetical protein WCJ42_00250 [Actinomycetes bacterium]